MPHLSASGIRSYMDCGLMYRFSRVDGIKPEFRPDNMEFGSTIHKALADFNAERMMGKTPELADLQKSFEDYWTKANEAQVRFSEGASFESFLNMGRNLLSACYEELISDSFTVVAIEEPFVFHMEGVGVPIIGIMDLVCEDPNGTVIIIDYKTVGKTMNQEDVNRDLQMSIYSMAAKANGYSNREILLRLDCLLKTKTPRMEQYYATRSSEDEKRVSRKIREVWRGIQNGLFIPNDTAWKCRTCMYQAHCEKWSQGDET